jgi:hemerythrin-like domain-containing protein
MYGLAQPAALGDPLEVLATCHQGIETHLAALELLPEHIAEHGVDAAAREAARFALRFFDTSAAEHQLDEEEDLFPLLRRRAGELERAEISAVINELGSDHHTMALQWRQLRELLNALAQGKPSALAPGNIAAFAWLNRRHLEKESAIVLPFAREALRAAERQQLAGRMAARRRARV